MRNFCLLVFLLTITSAINGRDFACPEYAVESIDPTGTYSLVSLTAPVSSDPVHAQGEIRVQQVDSNRIFVCLQYTGRRPSLNGGSFYDTLHYTNNSVQWRCPEYDSTCLVTITFSKSGADVVQQSSASPLQCGFGHDVHCDGFYRKISNALPRFDEQCGITSDTIQFIDPTGTYRMGPLAPPDAEDPLGETGDIRIKYLCANKILLCLFYVGYGPAYNVAYFQDTLIYDDNWAEWRCEEWEDSACVVRFAFSTAGINVKVHFGDPDFPCGFGHNAHPDGYYRKLSDAEPSFGDWCQDSKEK